MNKKSVVTAGKISLVVLLIMLMVFLIFMSISSFASPEKKQYQLGEKVKIDLKGSENFKLKITTPSTSFVKKGSDEVIIFKPEEIGKYKVSIETKNEKKEYEFEVISKANPKSGEINITQESNETINNSGDIQETAEINKKVKWKKKTGEEYFTEAPKAEEKKLSSMKKQVKISSPENIHYENVLAYSDIDDIIPLNNKDMIKVYWLEQNKFLDFESKDTNGNGMIDRVEWIVPHLSNQTFEIIIITKAIHLDENRNFISDIYEQVKSLDNVWSETIPEEHYVRVTFEKQLGKDNDITIYPRVISGSPKIEVYEADKSEIIAEFSSLQSNQYNKVYLTNLQNSQNTFDLKVVGGSVEYDYIVDPIANDSLNNIYQCGNIDSPGVYALNQSINSTTTCLYVTADNVEINCRGFKVIYGTGVGNLAIGINASNGTAARTNLTLRNCLIVKAAATGTTGYGIFLSRFNNSLIYNNTIMTNGTNNNYGIYILTNSTGNNITGNNIFSKGSTTSNIGVYLGIGATDTIVSYNNISTLGTGTNYGIYAVGNANYNNNDNLFSYNIINTSGRVGAGGANNHGIYITANASSNTITNNMIKTDGTTTNHGIYLLGVAAATPVNNNTINWNNVTVNGTTTPTNYGIYVSTNANNNDITNNNVVTAGTTNNWGISIVGTAALASNNNEISSNNIMTMGTTTLNYGIYVTTNTNSNNITNNIISTNGTTANYGIYLVGAVNGNSDYNIIDSNNISTLGTTNLNHGIYITTNASYNNITYNTILANGSTGNYGIYLVGAANANSDYNLIYSNNIKAVGTAAIASNIGIWIDTNTNNNNITNNDVEVYGTTNSQGIELRGAAALPCSNNIIASNNILVNGSSPIAATDYGIFFTANTNSNTIISNNITTRGNTTGYGIYFFGAAATPANNNIIFYNNITTIGTGESNHGIYIIRNTNSNNITYNTILASGTANNYGIFISNSTNDSILSNNILTAGTTTGNYGISFAINSTNSDIFSNIIITQGTNNNHGIYISGATASSIMNYIFNNSISTRGTGTNNTGIYLLANASMNWIEANVVATGDGRGTTSNNGVYIDNSWNNTITNNTISTNGTTATSAAFYIYENSRNNTFAHNIILKAMGHGIYLGNTTLVNFPHENIFINNSFSNIAGSDLFFAGTSINRTLLQDQQISGYNFTSKGGTIIVENTNYGKIIFLNPVNGTGINLSADIIIGYNFVYANSAQKGLNVSANVSLYNLPTNFTNPGILRDNRMCQAGVCYNFTSLNNGNVSFNVSYWSSYSIISFLIPVINLIYPSDNFNFSSYIVTQFNFTVNHSNNIDSCVLYGNWSSGWHVNQTITSPAINENINFSLINTLKDEFYIWNVECTDEFGSIGRNSTNFTFSTFIFPNAPAPMTINITQNRTDGTGNITIYWNSSNHTLYYKIYYSNNLKQGFSLLNTTTNINYTDYQANSERRRFYRITAFNPAGENESGDIFGKTVYSLNRKDNTGTRNWITLYFNSSETRTANKTLNILRNATTLNTWNNSIQKRITCNKYSCPNPPECSDTLCNFNIVPESGYEVNINSSAPLQVNTSIVGKVYNITTISLIKNSTNFGKNWVPIYANTTLNSTMNLIINVSNADAVTYWDSSNQKSVGLVKSNFPGIPYIGINSTIEIENSYEVSVTQSSNWTQI